MPDVGDEAKSVKPGVFVLDIVKDPAISCALEDQVGIVAGARGHGEEGMVPGQVCEEPVGVGDGGRGMYSYPTIFILL